MLHLCVWVLGSDALPLSNRRVMITSPRQYALKLASRLIEAGARPVWVPTIEIARLSTPETLQVSSSCVIHV